MKPVFLFIQIGAMLGSIPRSILLGWWRKENRHAGQHLRAQLKGIKQNLGGLSLSCSANTDQPASVHSLQQFHKTAPLATLSLFFFLLFTLSPCLPQTTLQKHGKWLIHSDYHNFCLPPMSLSCLQHFLPWLTPQWTMKVSLIWNIPASLEGNHRHPPPTTICKTVSRNIIARWKVEV